MTSSRVSPSVEVFVKDRELVVPGQPLGTGKMGREKNIYTDDEGVVRAAKIGLVQLRRDRIGLIPLKGGYSPKTDDLVIGKVDRISRRVIFMDIYTFYGALLLAPKEDMRNRRSFRASKYEKLGPGDVIFAKVLAADEASSPILTIRGEGLGKLSRGCLIWIEPSKVPRALGKRHSMVSLIKEKTRCDIIIGQNGVVWVASEDPELVDAIEKALRKIERESHVSGLTERIGDLLDSLKGGRSR